MCQISIEDIYMVKIRFKYTKLQATTSMLCPAHETLQKFSIVILLTASLVDTTTTLEGT